jgi:NADP-dependent 3-hydroxy acid dehydrogenase YdfG
MLIGTVTFIVLSSDQPTFLERIFVTKSSIRVALVTGCSSGIGRATALHLRRAGLTVYATARKLDRLAELADQGIRTLAMDVTDEASMVAAVEQIAAEAGGVDVLVNNAGYKLLGAVEEVAPHEVIKQFDTNVFGLSRMTQLVLPGMRERGYGRIVNMSSVYGRFAVPGGAYPAATKHAVAAFTDALRVEVARFGIRVVLIEPAAARTDLEAKAVRSGDYEDGPYARFNRAVDEWHAKAVSGPPYNLAGWLAVTPDDVARVVTRAATRRRPRGRYPVGVLAHLTFLLRRVLPTSGFDAFVRVTWPVP